MRSPFGSLALAFALAACASSPPPPPVTPAALRDWDDKWRTAFAASEPSPEGSKALASVPAGAEVVVVLGTWCGDSRREVSRFVEALELAGRVPFQVKWVNVDRNKEAPGFDPSALGIRYVPTFVVFRGDREVGRVVESSPGGIEHDVGALLRGEKSGPISASR